MSRPFDNLPFAPACERNREPILQALLPHLLEAGKKTRRLLEIGSGTGQHAAYFTEFFCSSRAKSTLHGLQWQCSDVAANLDAIAAWRVNAGTLNFLPPIELDLAKRNFPLGHYDFIYTANTLHIMSWQLVQAFCDCVASCLVDDGKLFIYGPFNYDDAYTSESNAQFDASLRARDPRSGIRDLAAVCKALAAAGRAKGSNVTLAADIEMPANNRLLVFGRARRA
ncbi:MAG: DUF938 domain-containing protein [Pseudomonadales bacterium]